ncbi:hypothetical protein Tco_0747346 [Tanacetum coccineum]|uniref:Uncharacterized protein n=1 Tax=Tanacetum coccineum TaxID=301880 RepID=A0ABQ4YSU1_9ASTR
MNIFSLPKKNFISDDNEERMVEKSFLEIQGTFLVKIRDNTFNGIIGENAFKHIDNFLEVVGPLKIKGLSQDRFRLSVFPILLAGAIETDENDDPDDIADIFKIEGNLFDFETPYQNESVYFQYQRNQDLRGNGKTKWPTYSLDIDGFCNGGQLPRMVRVGCMTYFQDHKWYDELTDGKLKEEALMHKARFEESWGDATPGVNAHENAPFTRWENHGQGPFEMMKYSFDADDEYVAIKERQHSDHSRTNVDACQAYRELFRIMDEGWLVTKAKEE